MEKKNAAPLWPPLTRGGLSNLQDPVQFTISIETRIIAKRINYIPQINLHYTNLEIFIATEYRQVDVLLYSVTYIENDHFYCIVRKGFVVPTSTPTLYVLKIPNAAPNMPPP